MAELPKDEPAVVLAYFLEKGGDRIENSHGFVEFHGFVPG
jgi:hypothetical protein